MKLLNFENLTFKVNSLHQKSSESFSFFSLKNMNIGANFLLLTFFDNINFQITLFSQMMPSFDNSPLLQFSKFNNFIITVDFQPKTFLILYPSLENSTTCIAIFRNFGTGGQARLVRLGWAGQAGLSLIQLCSQGSFQLKHEKKGPLTTLIFHVEKTLG